MRIIRILATAAALAALPATSYASTLIIDISQSGANIVTTVSGNVDTADLQSLGAFYLPTAIGSYGYVGTGTDGATGIAYTGFTGPSGFGSQTFSLASGVGSGDIFAFNAGNGNFTDIFVDPNYVSGSAIDSSMIVDNASLTALGFVLGQYKYTAGSNTVLVNVGSASAVPEPATWALMLAGFGMVGYAMRRRARVTVAYA